MKKIIKRIGLIILLLAVGALLAYGSYHISKKFVKDTNVKITFEDNETFTLEDVSELSEEEALKLWPYIFHMENEGNREANFKLVISDVSGDIKRDNLDYFLMRDDKKVASGHLKDLKDNILYKGEINKKEKNDYKLYIWVTSKDAGTKYEYSIKLEFDN